MDYCGYFSEGVYDEYSDRNVHFFIESEDIEGLVESRMECDKDHCFLYHLNVQQKISGEGVGKCVVKNAESFAKDLGLDHINASVGVNTRDRNYGAQLRAFEHIFDGLGWKRGHISYEPSKPSRMYYTRLDFGKSL